MCTVLKSLEQSLYNIYLELRGFEVHGVLDGPLNSVLGGPGVILLFLACGFNEINYY